MGIEQRVAAWNGRPIGLLHQRAGWHVEQQELHRIPLATRRVIQRRAAVLASDGVEPHGIAHQRRRVRVGRQKMQR